MRYFEAISDYTIHETYDYSLFKILKGNREINKLHLKRLFKSIYDKYLFTIVIVNEKYEIMNGQHRFNVLKSQGLPILYVMVKGYGLEEVQRFNTNTKNWAIADFTDGYKSLGNREYEIYDYFVKKYKFGHFESMCLLLNLTSGPGKEHCDEFRAGIFKVRDFGKAQRYADMLQEIGKYYDGYRRRSFIWAMLKVFENPQYGQQRFLNKLSYQAGKIQDATKAEHYARMIDEAYNYKVRIGNTVDLYGWIKRYKTDNNGQNKQS